MQNTANWKRSTAAFLSSQLISLFGSSIVGFAIIWHLTLKTSSGMVMTILVACTFLPQILISLFAGVWADRYPRKKLIIYADLFIASSTLVLAILFMSGYDGLWIIYLVSAIRSFGMGIQTPAVAAILPQLVPKEYLMKVNALNSSIGSMMMILSPAAGGLLLSFWPLQAALLVDVVTALLAVFIFIFIPAPMHEVALGADGKPRKTDTLIELKEGISYAKNHSMIKYLLIFYAIFFFLITPAAFLTPILVERSFGSEVWRLTANELAWSGGALIGGIIITFWGGFKNKIYSITVACIAFGIFFTLLGLSSNFTFYLTCMLLSGLFMPLFSTAETVLIQEQVHEYMMGRVFSMINLLASIAMLLGMIIFGPAADFIKIQYLLIGCGILTLGLGVYIYCNKKILYLASEKFD